MKTSVFLLACLLGIAASACTTLPRGSVSSDEEEDEMLVSEADAAPMTASDASTPPNQLDVAWEDNGIPIRQLTGPGREQAMKVPAAPGRKQGALVIPVTAAPAKK